MLHSLHRERRPHKRRRMVYFLLATTILVASDTSFAFPLYPRFIGTSVSSTIRPGNSVLYSHQLRKEFHFATNSTISPAPATGWATYPSYGEDDLNFETIQQANTMTAAVFQPPSIPQMHQLPDSRLASEVWNARFLLLSASALYGTTFSFVKLLGEQEIPVGISSTLRFGLAALSMLPCLLARNHNTEKHEGFEATLWGLEVGLWNSIGYVAQAVGLETTPASESAFICSLAVVTVPILDYLAGKAMGTKQWIGIALAVLGVAILELGDMSTTALTTNDWITLTQPFFFGLGFWRMEQAMKRFPTEAPRLAAAQLFSVFLASLSYAVWSMDMETIQSFPWKECLTNSDVLFGLFWTGIVTTAATIYMETLAMKTLSAAETTLIFSTEPLWGAAFASMVMGEAFGVNAALGALCIVTACVYSSHETTKPHLDTLEAEEISVF